jgi:nucleotide-binding universal stress UspA family protein
MIGVSETGSIREEYPRIGPCVLGPISEETTYRRAASVAHALATSRDIDLLVSAEAEVADTADNPESLPESHRDGHCSSTSAVETEMALDPVVSEHNPSALVIERHAEQHLIGELFSDRAERLSSQTDVLTVDGRGTTDRIASILVPIAGGHHSQLAVETAVAVARANDAAVDLFHVIESDDEASQDRGQTVLKSALATISEEDAERVDTWLYEAPDATEAITEQSAYYDLTVMGAPTVGPLERFVFGSTSKHVQREADSPVIVAHAQDTA